MVLIISEESERERGEKSIAQMCVRICVAPRFTLFYVFLNGLKKRRHFSTAAVAVAFGLLNVRYIFDKILSLNLFRLDTTKETPPELCVCVMRGNFFSSPLSQRE